MDSLPRPYDSSVNPTPLDALLIALVEAGLVRVKHGPGVTVTITLVDSDQRVGRLSRAG